MLSGSVMMVRMSRIVTFELLDMCIAFVGVPLMMLLRRYRLLCIGSDLPKLA